MATTPPPPTRGSMTNACLSSSVIRLVRRRANTSLLPPAAKPITVVTGFDGQSVGCAPASDTGNVAESARAPKIDHRDARHDDRGRLPTIAGIVMRHSFAISGREFDLATRFGAAASDQAQAPYPALWR